MAGFYAHERVAKRAAELIGEHGGGAPRGLFDGRGKGRTRCSSTASGAARRGGSLPASWGLHLHAVRCPEFLWGLVAGARQACRRPIRGLFTHYALDQILHPYIYDQCRKGQNFGYTGGGHGVAGTRRSMRRCT